MAIKFNLSVTVKILVFVVVMVVNNAIPCEGRKVSSVGSHSSFLRGRLRNRHGWCGHDSGICSRSAHARGYYHGKWACCSKRHCIDVSSDPSNCGSCGHACGYGLRCCGGKCLDLNVNNAHCGSCFNSCHHDTCTFGICGYGYGYGFSSQNHEKKLGH
ncbi:hypothetical protein SUGI_0821580 [Cryptomeria japonica]|nr:hypothetical protein SUGI_0821580 [Cryptomeria japonica]